MRPGKDGPASFVFWDPGPQLGRLHQKIGGSKNGTLGGTRNLLASRGLSMSRFFGASPVTSALDLPLGTIPREGFRLAGGHGDEKIAACKIKNCTAAFWELRLLGKWRGWT
jgi:hypothetical protein